MNKLMTIGSLGIAGILTTGVLATQTPAAFARGGDDPSAVVRADDRGRDHAEDGPRHDGPHHAHDDNGRHHGHHHGHHHGQDDHGHHGDDD